VNIKEEYKNERNRGKETGKIKNNIYIYIYIYIYRGGRGIEEGESERERKYVQTR
jgi:hypothetical protein